VSPARRLSLGLPAILTICICISSFLLVSWLNPAFGATVIAPPDYYGTIPPGGYIWFTPTKISINNGQVYTNTRTVSVFVNATAAGFPATGMQLSNDNSGWTSYAYTAPYTQSWTLSSGDGPKTVYVRFIGNGTSSSYSDTITLDTTAPTLTITTPTSGATIQQTICTMNWTSSDAGSGISSFEAWVDSSSHVTLTSATNSNVFAGLSEASHTFNLKATDGAGNTQTRTVSITVSIPPGTGSILISNGALYTTTASITLNLAASAGVDQMSFSTPENTTWSTWEAFAATKSWTLSGGDGAKTVSVMYKFSGITNPSIAYNATILLDTTPPTVSITAPANGAQLTSTTCEASWTATDPTSGIEHYEIKVDSGDWLYVGNLTSYPIIGLPDGSHSLSVKAVDRGGLSQTTTANIVVSAVVVTTPTPSTATTTPTPTPSPSTTQGTTPSPSFTTSPTASPQKEEGQFPMTYIVIIAVVVFAVLFGALLFFKFMRKPKRPQLRVKAEPANLVADGQTRATITLQLVDRKGNPLPALSDTPIRVTAKKGKLQDPVVTILKGKDTEKTFIISSTETGPAPVSVDAEGLKSITITLNFTEKSRYCMHCGTVMHLKAKECPNCGKAPPAGADTKVCGNCEAVIPIVAKFCSECGAGQAT
jgi:RNA polymerase subunit RPABC4/transcription elongation factor Spt4